MQEVKKEKTEKELENNQLTDNEENNKMGQEDKNEESPNNNEQEKPKIYFVELIFIFPILITADIMDLLSLTGIGVVLSLATDMIATGVTTFWLFWKGRRVEWNLIANLLEFIPIVDVLPIRTTMMIILLVKDSKMGKKALKKVEKVIDKTPAGKAVMGSEKIINKASAIKK